MRKPYIPTPGTIPFRVIEHLQGLPADTELSTVELEDILDISRGTLTPFLAVPRKYGLLRTRNKPDDKRLIFWSLGDGTPEPLPEDHEEDEPLHPPARSDTSLVGQPKQSKPKLVRIIRDPFSVAVTLDGRMTITDEGVQIHLTREKAALVTRMAAAFAESN